MDEVVEIIAYSLSIIALILVASLLVVDSYFKIRRCFPTHVNCWFCNTWTWVPYDNWNSFECPSCLQYNGFNADGGYNKVIEAQHRYSRMSPSNSHGSSNGLCSNCNRNQQLKIIQLAKFTPLVEDNYDEEIEHFRKQLEKVYQLCSACKRFLETTLLKEKATFFANHVINNRRKKVNIYEKLKQKSIVFRSEIAMVKLLKYAQTILSIFVILSVAAEVLRRLHPEWFSITIQPYYEASLEITNLFSPYLYPSERLGCNQLFLGISIGTLIQIPLYFLEESLMCIKVNQLLCWSFLALTSWNKPEELLIFSFQIVCGFVIFYNSFVGFRTSLPRKVMMKKLKPLQEHTDKHDDYSDDECLKPVLHKNKMTYNTAEFLTANNLGSRISDVRCNLKSMEPGESSYCSDIKKNVFNSSHGEYKMTSDLHRDVYISGEFWKNNDVNIMSVHSSRMNSLNGNFGLSSQGDGKCSPTFSYSQNHHPRPTENYNIMTVHQNRRNSLSGSYGVFPQRNGQSPIFNINQSHSLPNGKDDFDIMAGQPNSDGLDIFLQKNEKDYPSFNNSQSHSLPSSIETSLSGEFGRLSVSPNSQHISPSPSSSQSNYYYRSPNISSSWWNSL